jgi:hypothetical protein
MWTFEGNQTNRRLISFKGNQASGSRNEFWATHCLGADSRKSPSCAAKKITFEENRAAVGSIPFKRKGHP